MSADFVESDRGDAVEVVVTGRWSDGAAEAFTSGRAQRLVLNHALGFEEPHLRFLVGLPVRELVLVDRRVDDLGPVEALGATLQRLEVVTAPGVRVDLAVLPHLRAVSADWEQVEASIAAVTALEEVHLGRYAAPDLSPLGHLGDLASLTMKDRPRLRRLDGADRLPGLRRLGVFLARALTDVSALRHLPGLESLDLEACTRLTGLDDLATCTALTRLNLSDCGDLSSLAPVRAMKRLEQVRLYGTTRILDQDLSPLADLPALQELRMRERRGYRPGVAEVQARLPR